ncbi:MAG: hypothetical protein R3C19_00275 [Planctomycetaceae bacterium]
MTVRMKSPRILAVALSVSAMLSLCESASAQLIKAPLDRGFVRSSSIAVSVDEMLGPKKQRSAEEPILGPGYPALRIAEVQYKPMRYVRMPITDPKTGETSRELVWYMVYRVISRLPSDLAGDKSEELVRKLNDPTLEPANPADPVQAQPVLLPRFILQTTDEGSQAAYADEVNLEVQQSVLRREFRQDAAGLPLLNSVQAVRTFPEPVPVDAENPLENALYGVAVWRNVDPETDYFTVTMTGFSNAYRISTSETGERVVEEKAIVQKFGRPGDRFLQDEAEFRVIDDPSWIYWQRPADLTVPEFESILRSAPIQAAGAPEPRE